MSLEQLCAILEAHTSRTAVDERRLALPPQAVTGLVQSAGLAGHLADGKLQLQLTAPLRQGEHTVTVQGRGLAQPFTGMAVEAVFREDGDRFFLTVTATGAEDWHFGRSFAALEGRVIARLPFAAPVLTLTGQESSAELRFGGALLIGGPLAFLQALFGGTGQIDLSGAIVVQNGVPVMDLAGPLLPPVKVDYLPEVKLGLRVQTRVLRPAKPYMSSRLVLEADLAFTLGGRVVHLPISANLDPQESLVVLEADTSQLSDVALDDLAQLVNGSDLAAFMPSRDWFDPGRLFQVAGCSLAVDPAALRIAYATVTVETKSRWEIIKPNVVAIEAPVRLLFTVTPGEPQPVSLGVMGRVRLGPTAVLDVGGRFPDFAVAGCLEEGSHINLTEIVEHFLQTQLNLPTLELNELEFLAAPGSGTYELIAGVTASPIKVGDITLQLEQAEFGIRQERESGGETSRRASLRAVTRLGPAELELDWAYPPNDFTIAGTVPEITISQLTQTLTGNQLTLPPGFPDVRFTNSTVALSRKAGGRPTEHSLDQSREAGDRSAEYSFALSTEIEALGPVSGLPKVSTFFELRRAAGATGIMAGFALPDQWTPACLWPEMVSVFGSIQFSGSAVLISTLKEASAPPALLKQKNLPATVEPGLTFCTTVALAGDALGWVRQVFGDPGGVMLRGLVNAADLRKSEFGLSFGAIPLGPDLRFNGVDLALMLNGTIQLSTSATLNVGRVLGGPHKDDVLIFKGAGTASIDNPRVNFSVALCGQTGSRSGVGSAWHEPFGIPKLAIVDVGLSVSGTSAGVDLGLMGAIELGAVDRGFRLRLGGSILNFEAPGALIARAESTSQKGDGLTLPAIITSLTDLPMERVPLLSDISLKHVGCTVVASPFTDPANPKKVYSQGFSVQSDMIFYGLEAAVDIEVLADKGIKASGNLSDVIRLGDVLVISDAEGKKGAHAKIDTTALTKIPSPDEEYINLSGKVQLFQDQVEERLNAKVKGDGFVFDIHYHVPGLKDFSLSCKLNGFKSFEAGGRINFGIRDRSIRLKWGDLDLGTLYLDFEVNAGLLVKLGLNSFYFKADGSFYFRGKELAYAYELDKSFKDLADIIRQTIEHLAARGWELFKQVLGQVEQLFQAIGKELRDLGADFGRLLRDFFQMAQEEAARRFREIGYAVEKVACILRDGYNLAAKAVAEVLKQVGYAANEIARALAEGLNVAAKEAARIFFDLGYAAATIIDFLVNLFGQTLADATKLVEALLSDPRQFCAAEAFDTVARAPHVRADMALLSLPEVAATGEADVGGPATGEDVTGDGLDGLRRLRSDLERSPDGSRGRRYLDLYNRHSARVHQLIMTDPDVQAHIHQAGGYEIWMRILHWVDSAMGGNPGTLPGKEEQERILDILSVIQDKDATLGDLINELVPELQEYIGMNYSQFLAAIAVPAG